MDVAVGFVGAGSMGTPMVERLLSAGVPVTVHARRPESREHLERCGATVVASVADAAAAADVLIVCPFSEDQLEEITRGPDGLLAHAAPGTVLVQHATVSVGGVVALADVAARAGVTVLDAPISGTSDDIRRGELAVLVGGPQPALDAVAGTLGHYARALVHTGDAGSASAVKVVNNLAFAANVQVAVAAVRLGEELGVAPAALLTAVQHCSADSRALRLLAASGDVDGFLSQIAPYLRKDLALVEVQARAAGADAAYLLDVVRVGPGPLGPAAPPASSPGHRAHSAPG